jgi:type I restriction enzyme S subunit
VIRLQNIGDGEFLDAEAHISEEHFQRLIKHAVRPGDLVCVLLGDTLPRAAIMPEDLGPAIVKADCPRVRLSPLVNHRFVWAALNAPSTRREASARRHGVGRPRLNLKELRQIPIPLPPRAEQDLLVDAMDRQLDAVYRLEADLTTRRSMSEALRSSILAAAFSGTLVQQDSSDEPAVALLHRIAAERAQTEDGDPASPRQRRRKAAV